MKLIYLCIPPHHSCDLLCMATLFVWYNGKVLHTWHYNWLVTHAGVCFLNNNPPPARALRNVITINLNRADQSWGGGAPRPTPSPMLSPTQWHTDAQHPECGWYCLTGREHEWSPHWSVITINAVVPSCIWFWTSLCRVKSGARTLVETHGDNHVTQPDRIKARQYLKY